MLTKHYIDAIYKAVEEKTIYRKDEFIITSDDTNFTMKIMYNEKYFFSIKAVYRGVEVSICPGNVLMNEKKSLMFLRIMLS